MKKLAFLASIMAGLLAVSAQAGEAVVPTDSKNVAPAPPSPEVFGAGFYMALDLGANVYQNRVSEETFTTGFFPSTLSISTDNKVGFYGGLKAGYVFGTGVFRPTIEADMFYNGWQAGGSATFNGGEPSRILSGNYSGNVNTGAFMSNFIGRFAFGRFQPYVGAGVGIYYAASPGFTVNTNVGTFNTVGSRTHADLAWDIVAGADYYFAPKMSTFIEYHYLDYTSSQIDTNQNRNLGQSLVGAGMRFHF